MRRAQGALSMTPCAARNTRLATAGRRRSPAAAPAASSARRNAPFPSAPRRNTATFSTTATNTSRSRSTAVAVRADVNWDAFRPSALDSASSAATPPSSARAQPPPPPAGVRLNGSLPAATTSPASSSAAASASPLGSVHQVDFLVLGSGIAGLTYALKVAEYGTVAVVTKDYAHEGCTQYAQGGVCAVMDRHDSVALHVRDTMVAGAFLNDPQ